MNRSFLTLKATGLVNKLRYIMIIIITRSPRFRKKLNVCLNGRFNTQAGHKVTRGAVRNATQLCL